MSEDGIEAAVSGGSDVLDDAERAREERALVALEADVQASSHQRGSVTVVVPESKPKPRTSLVPRIKSLKLLSRRRERESISRAPDNSFKSVAIEAPEIEPLFTGNLPAYFMLFPPIMFIGFFVLACLSRFRSRELIAPLRGYLVREVWVLGTVSTPLFITWCLWSIVLHRSYHLLSYDENHAWRPNFTGIELLHITVVSAWILVNGIMPSSIFNTSNLRANIIISIGSSLCVLVFMWALKSLRSYILRRPRRDRIAFMNDFAREVRVLLIFELCCLAFTIAIMTTKPIITYSITRLEPTHVCDVEILTNEYIATNCTGLQMGTSGHTQFRCRDPGGWFHYVSRYDACLAASAIVTTNAQMFSLLWLQGNAIIFVTLRAFGKMRAQIGHLEGAPKSLSEFVADLVMTIPYSLMPLYLTSVLVKSTYQPSTFDRYISESYIQIVNTLAVLVALSLYNVHHLTAFLLSRLREAKQETALEYDCFLSHDWGVDEEGRDNHARVAKVNETLKAAGLVTWFDSERMSGNLTERMTEGIDRSGVFLVFVTQNYIQKAAGDGPHGQNDNVRLEFDYACRRKGIEKMVACLMEPSGADAREWYGPVGFRLGGQLYHDLSGAGDAFTDGLSGLIGHVQRLMGDRRTASSALDRLVKKPSSKSPLTQVTRQVTEVVGSILSNRTSRTSRGASGSASMRARSNRDARVNSVELQGA